MLKLVLNKGKWCQEMSVPVAKDKCEAKDQCEDQVSLSKSSMTLKSLTLQITLVLPQCGRAENALLYDPWRVQEQGIPTLLASKFIEKKVQMETWVY